MYRPAPLLMTTPPLSLSLSLALALALVLLCGVSQAQIQAGNSVCTVALGVAGQSTKGEIYEIDHTTGKATLLTFKTGSTLQTDVPNTILMDNILIGYVGTNTPTPPANIYKISILRGAINETRLNTLATQNIVGNNLSQIVHVGSRLYFVTQDAAGTGGVLQSIADSGGAVTVEADLGAAGSTNLINALTVMGNKLYAASFNSSSNQTANGQLMEYDLSATPRKAVKVMDLPPGKYVLQASTGPLVYAPGIVSMHPHPGMPGKLALCGVHGDLIIIDPSTKKVVQHDFHGFKGTTSMTRNLVNSFSWDANRKDWVVGSRDGHVERWVDGHSAEKIIKGVGSDATPAYNSVNGMHHFAAAKGIDHAVGGGCPGTGGYTPTDVALGLPIVGNTNFKFALYSGNPGDQVLLFFGLVPLTPPLDLKILGAPSCFLRTPVTIQLRLGAFSGTGAGLGKLIIPVPIAAGTPVGVKLYRQWLVAEATPTNAAGLLVTNARLLNLQ